jgi:hypothetical protein
MHGLYSSTSSPTLMISSFTFLSLQVPISFDRLVDSPWLSFFLALLSLWIRLLWDYRWPSTFFSRFKILFLPVLLAPLHTIA